MTVLYVARKKVFKSEGELKELYYAVPRPIQGKGKGINNKNLAEDLAKDSSVMPGDVLSILDQFPRKIVHYLKAGRTVTIEGLGTFYLSLNSEGVERPEECRPTKLRKVNVCFRADDTLKERMKGCEFELLNDQISEKE
ncbi:MAG: HU family DNA-binding protein [Bacteroides sp.]|nr:HU family DNA-binding protein [Bacteroides sp.]